MATPPPWRRRRGVMNATGAAQTTERRAHPPADESKRERRVLLVEDQAIIALATAARIRQNGYVVETAGSGQAALEAVESAAAESRPFDLILMDIDMGPGMDGIETAQRVLAERRVPIIFLTAHAEPEYVERVRRVSRYGYVFKNSGDLILKLSMEMALDLFDAHERTLMRELQLETVIAHAPVAMLVVDEGYRILRSNARGEAMSNMAESEMVGAKIGAVLRCIHALNHPHGCGSTPHCSNCPLPRMVRDGLDHGLNHDAEHIRLPIGEEQVDLAVSTVLLKEAPRREVLVSVWEPGNVDGPRDGPRADHGADRPDDGGTQ